MSHADLALIADIRAALRAAADPAIAPAMRAYMKSTMPFYGIKKPARVAALKPVFARHPIEAGTTLRDTALLLWRSAAHREERYAALDLTGLRRHRAHLVPRALPMYEEMIVTGAWWDYVDEIAAQRLLPILEHEPPRVGAVMRRWARGRDMWKRRSAILCQLKRRDRTDLSLLVDCLEPSLGSTEFFLRKAMGWALRELGKTNPRWVRSYVTAHETELSGLSKREALKHL